MQNSDRLCEPRAEAAPEKKSNNIGIEERSNSMSAAEALSGSHGYH